MFKGDFPAFFSQKTTVKETSNQDIQIVLFYIAVKF